ncbi:MAG: hypothetical protein DHS20C01_25500 [marine bacterium B5-7]|nr:MAG: hypothetical protein DHS20C01_25500 [marine bacterium B5-7]
MPILLGLIVLSPVNTIAEETRDWIPELISDTLITPGDQTAMRVKLPPDMPFDSVQWLALEIDAVDVSEIVKLEQVDSTLIVSVTPPQPLDVGQHELRLVEYSPVGDILERGLWTLDVVGANGSVQTSDITKFFSANFSLEGNYRLAEGDLLDDGASSGAQGAVAINGAVAGQSITTEVDANFIYDSNGAQVGSVLADAIVPGEDPRQGREFEVGEYKLSAQGNGVTALLGHHAPVADGLLIQDFYRRGVSLTGKTDGEALIASGFAYRTEPVSGFRYGLSGVGDHQHRVAGGMLSVSPLPSGKDPLTITATYLSGEGQDHSGLGIVGNDILPQGDGYSIAAESNLASRRIKLRGEFAETRYDFDGSGDAFDRNDDDARSFLGLFHIFKGKSFGQRQADFSIGYEQKEIGLFFRSLANPSLPFDRKLDRVFSVLQVDGLAVQLQLAQEQDNVDNDPNLPTLYNDLASLSLSWTPAVGATTDDKPLPGWLGQPTFTVAAQYSDQIHEDVPILFDDFAINRQTTTLLGGVTTRYENVYLGLNHSYSIEKDFGDFGIDNHHELTDFSVQWQANNRFLFGTQLQYNAIKDELTGNVTRTRLAGIDLSFLALDDRLNTTVNYSVNRDGDRDDLTDSRIETLGVRFDWQLRQSDAQQPGWTLWLYGERQKFEDRVNPGFDLSPYQVFVGARMDWSVATQSP